MSITAISLGTATDFDLQLQLLAGTGGLQRPITSTKVQKSGLILAGLSDALRPGCLQILGRMELKYLTSQIGSLRAEALKPLLAKHVPSWIITHGSVVPEDILTACNLQEVPLWRTPLSSISFIERIHAFLNEQLSQQVSLHGVLLDVFGVGILLTGQSGIGKSECALDLILRGHRLVADDVVEIKQREAELIGSGSPLTKHYMEVRGLGIIHVRDLFGAASVLERKRLELVIEMVEWDPQAPCDRLGLDDTYQEILWQQIPKITLPIRPGRNVAAIIEVAARNHLQKMQGYHAAKAFQERFEEHLAREQKAFIDQKSP